MLVDVVHVVDRMAGKLLVRVEQSKVFLPAVEEKPADRLPVVVVEYDPAVALRVSHDDTVWVHNLADDRLDDVEPFQLILGGDDTVVIRSFCPVAQARLS